MVMVVKDKREIIKSYDSLGGRIYDLRYSDEQEAKYKIILDKLETSPRDIVLDDGCGTGLLLQRLDAHCVGLDLTSSLLSTARTRISKNTKADLVQADADHLPFRSKTFHKVFAVTLIQDKPSLNQTLREMRRVGRPSSKYAITALKKAFSKEGFEKVLEDSGFVLFTSILNMDSKDYFAFVEMKIV